MPMGTSMKWACFDLLLLAILFNFASSQSIIGTLPGYSGLLPFKLETGYIGVGEKDEAQLFYYFIESEMDPDKDPLVLWLTGGPGCSAFSGLVFEIGPLIYDYADFDGNLPSFRLNPYSWTKIASIIFLDAPVGAGFSYSTTTEGYHSSDTKSSKDIYNFLKKWLLDHPRFNKNPLYIAGDSSAGMLVPMIALEISNGNEAEVVGNLPHRSLHLQGYILGNPATDPQSDQNSKVTYAHRMGIVSDKHYKSAKHFCRGEYVNLDPNNAQCNYYLRLIEESTSRINKGQILEPQCESDSPIRKAPQERGRRFLRGISTDIRLHPQQEKLWCRNQNYLPSYVWANDPTVRGALHIRNGTKGEWKRCNLTLSYVNDVPSVLSYHEVLSSKDYRVLIYSGDHDMIIPYIGTLEWIRNLNLTIIEDWRPWSVDGQVAGFTEKYKENYFSLTFSTIKGGGHTAPEYKPKECFAMVDRWFSLYQL